VWRRKRDPQFRHVVARAWKIRVPQRRYSQEDVMLTSRNNDPRWILATIVRKWKLPIWGVAWIVLRDVFMASIFLAYMEPQLFSPFRVGKFSSAAPNYGAEVFCSRPKVFRTQIVVKLLKLEPHHGEICQTQNTNKTQLLASNYGTN
jgi:hypothetical protein